VFSSAAIGTVPHPWATARLVARLDTAIIAGMEAGMHTILVLSGISSAEGIRRFPFRPNEIVDGVHELLDVPLEARSELGPDTTGSPEVQSSRGARRPRRRLRRRTCLLRVDPPRKPRANRNGPARRGHKPPRRDRSTLVTAPVTAEPTPPRRSLQGRGQPHRRVHIAAGERSLLPRLES